jgi:hypothetical protein
MWMKPGTRREAMSMGSGGTSRGERGERAETDQRRVCAVQTLRLLILHDFIVINVGTRIWGTKSSRVSGTETLRCPLPLSVARYG